MSTRLYRIGDVVSLNSDHGQLFSNLNPFTVEAQLPHLGTKLQYRIKSRSEHVWRVVAENQIITFGAQPNTDAIIVLGSTVTRRGRTSTGAVDQAVGRT